MAGGLRPVGTAQLDFSRDERLPEAPVWTAVPRGDGGVTVVRTASLGLSPAWKLRWLVADAATEDGPRCKDLYDAVLPAEAGRERILPAPPRLAGVRVDERAWQRFRATHPGMRGSAAACPPGSAPHSPRAPRPEPAQASAAAVRRSSSSRTNERSR
ncbi:hypothetical protein BCL76_11643 [Streptomyces sp. CG 926]|uniref:hypothetical protein n=1 Tax=Streptomyces sp. CG 926 TaxID=1882405 RepID=UPI000D6C550D|nr:hypothetical protein [Streptomyces sp. CG 926]PWK64181.1 hypothetical protein BCL76_11643 [Streptomyces sp. CG 926]